MGINKVILVGNVGKDPEIRSLQNGKVASFTLATSETYKDKQGQKVTNTEWHNVVVYGAQADVIEKWVKKGSQLYIEGKIKTNSYNDKDGNKKYVTNIVAESFQFIGSNNNSSQQTGQTTQVNNAPEPEQNDFTNSGEGDDLPF